jgi:hypothetical protein
MVQVIRLWDQHSELLMQKTQLHLLMLLSQLCPQCLLRLQLIWLIELHIT